MIFARSKNRYIAIEYIRNMVGDFIGNKGILSNLVTGTFVIAYFAHVLAVILFPIIGLTLMATGFLVGTQIPLVLALSVINITYIPVALFFDILIVQIAKFHYFYDFKWEVIQKKEKQLRENVTGYTGEKLEVNHASKKS